MFTIVFIRYNYKCTYPWVTNLCSRHEGEVASLYICQASSDFCDESLEERKNNYFTTCARMLHLTVKKEFPLIFKYFM